MIISFGDEKPNYICEAFHLIEISSSRELIFHKEWSENLKEVKLLIVPKSKAFLRSELSLLVNYFEPNSSFLWDWEKS